MPDIDQQVWAIVIDGKPMRLWDLPIDEMEEIATRHNRESWVDLIFGPVASPAAARELVGIAAKKLGVAQPPTETARELWTLFQRVSDELPGSYTNGIPNPKADGEETTS